MTFYLRQQFKFKTSQKGLATIFSELQSANLHVFASSLRFEKCQMKVRLLIGTASIDSEDWDSSAFSIISKHVEKVKKRLVLQVSDWTRSSSPISDFVTLLRGKVLIHAFYQGEENTYILDVKDLEKLFRFFLKIKYMYGIHILFNLLFSSVLSSVLSNVPMTQRELKRDDLYW